MHSISFILLAFSVTVIQSLPQTPTDEYPKPIQISSNDVGDNGNFLLPGSTDSSGDPTDLYNENPRKTTLFKHDQNVQTSFRRASLKKIPFSSYYG